MIGIRRDHDGPRLHGEQVIVPHESRQPFMVHQQATSTQFCRDAPIAIPAPVFDGDPLNGRPDRHLFFHGLVRPRSHIRSILNGPCFDITSPMWA
jgi:hypothetical protein